MRCVGGCSRCSSCWLASTFSVSSWRCASYVFPRLLRDRAGKPRRNRTKTQEALPAQSAEAAARSAAARLQASVRARCLDALAVPLVVVLVLVGASSPSPLAVFAAIFALLLRLPCLRLSLRTRFPFHDSQVLFSMKSRSKFLPGRPWKFQDFFFRPRRLPKSAREAIWAPFLRSKSGSCRLGCFGKRFRLQK